MAKNAKRQHADKETPSPWERFKASADGIDAICDHVSTGESLNSFCRANGFAYVTVLDWINADPVRAENYAHAREAREETVFDSLDVVSDQAVKAESAVTVAGLRLKADTIKWKLARMAPKKYGDKLAVGGADDLPPIRTRIEASDEELAAIALGLFVPKK